MPSATLARRWRGRATAAGTRAVVERMPLCIAQAPAPPRFGFFFGGAAVDSVVRRAQDHRYGGSGPLRTGHLSSPWVLAKLAALALVGRANIPAPTLEIEAEGCGSLRGEIRLLLATTLLHRTGLFDPYAARGRGDLRLTAVTAARPALLAGFAAPADGPILEGHESRQRLPQRQLRAGADRRPRRLRARRRALRHRPGAAGRHHPGPAPALLQPHELGLDPHPHLGAEPRRAADARRLRPRLPGPQRRGDLRRPRRRPDGRPRHVDAAVDAEPGDAQARPAAVAAGAGGDARGRVPRPAADARRCCCRWRSC